MIVVVAHVFEDSEGYWAHLASTVLPTYITNTLWLLAGVTLGTAILGTSTAWLVTMCSFPGRRWLQWALLLPMAMPAYLMAYAYTDLLQYRMPSIRSLPGAALMLILVLYPYVYLLARAAFLEQSTRVLEVSRTLGQGAWKTFVRVALPLARPGIAGGVALAAMETLADYGTVDYFAVDTFSTGIYRAWSQPTEGPQVAAAQLSAAMLGFALVLLALERLGRRGRPVHSSSRHALPRWPLSGVRAAGALLLCLLPVVLGLLLPVGILARLTLEGGDAMAGDAFGRWAAHSATLGGLAAVLAVGAALIIAYARRLDPSRGTRIATGLATLGYAVPGSILAVGVMRAFGWMDQQVDGFAREHFGVATGLLLSGTIVALVFGYLTRFLAVAVQAVQSGLERIPRDLDHAARTLGERPLGVLRRVHAPLMPSSLLVAGLLVFVDVVKELPASMILSPFDFDTLAVRVHRLASHERLAEASTGALAIVAVGLVPVILLSRVIARSRTARTSSARSIPTRSSREA